MCMSNFRLLCWIMRKLWGLKPDPLSATVFQSGRGQLAAILVFFYIFRISFFTFVVGRLQLVTCKISAQYLKKLMFHDYFEVCSNSPYLGVGVNLFFYISWQSNFCRTKVPRTVFSKLCAGQGFQDVNAKLQRAEFLFAMQMALALCQSLCQSSDATWPSAPSPHPMSWRCVANTQKIPRWWSGMQLTRRVAAVVRLSCLGQIPEGPC